MGLLQKAVETYDYNNEIVGKIREGKEILAPIAHIVTTAKIEIELDCKGAFISARLVDKSEPKIIIPVTEESAGRTSSPCPHPLCEQVKYVAPYNEELNLMYLSQLIEWEKSVFSHPILTAVRTYVENGTILEDLKDYVKFDSKGMPEDDKMLVRWRVIGLGQNVEPACWKNKELFDAFSRFYLSKVQSSNIGFCMISGNNECIADQHPKGIIPINGNAKLISANDSSGYTYRGRFENEKQAVSVGYESSQKAHNALRWLAAEQGVIYGGRTFICWNPQGIVLPGRKGRFHQDETEKRVPSEYKKALQSTLANFKKDNQLDGSETAVLAAFDAATTGRLSVTYYNELSVLQYVERLSEWEEHCCWFYFGKMQSPNLLEIVNFAFGTQRSGKGKTSMETDDRVLKQHFQRLLVCRTEGGNMPLDIVKALTQRASMPHCFEPEIWRKMTYIACAVLQKYRYDMRIGGEEMSWSLMEPDRSFQFGRLLAAMDQVEEDFYYNDGSAGRQSNAIKCMSEFRQRPWHVFERVNRHLQLAYLSRLSGGSKIRYQKICEEVVSILNSFPQEELNQPLSDLYLMGYMLQKNSFYAGKENKKTEEE